MFRTFFMALLLDSKRWSYKLHLVGKCHELHSRYKEDGTSGYDNRILKNTSQIKMNEFEKLLSNQKLLRQLESPTINMYRKVDMIKACETLPIYRGINLNEGGLFKDWDV